MTHISELKRILKANFLWHQQRIATLGRLVLALIKVRNVNLTELVCAFGGKATWQSNYCWLQRFFADYALSLCYGQRSISNPNSQIEPATPCGRSNRSRFGRRSFESAHSFGRIYVQCGRATASKVCVEQYFSPVRIATPFNAVALPAEVYLA